MTLNLYLQPSPCLWAPDLHIQLLFETCSWGSKKILNIQNNILKTELLVSPSQNHVYKPKILRIIFYFSLLFILKCNSSTNPGSVQKHVSSLSASSYHYICATTLMPVDFSERDRISACHLAFLFIQFSFGGNLGEKFPSYFAFCILHA